MRKDEAMADLFTAHNALMAKAKTEAEKMRALAKLLEDTANRTDLTDRAHALQLCYLAGAASAQLRMAAATIERGA